MPSRRVHNYTCKIILGKCFDKVHAEIDRPVKWLGRRHRILNHTPAEAALIARRVSSDPRAVSAAMLHLRYDELCSKDPQLRQRLEYIARGSSGTPRRRSQRHPVINTNHKRLGNLHRGQNHRDLSYHTTNYSRLQFDPIARVRLELQAMRRELELRIQRAGQV